MFKLDYKFTVEITGGDESLITPKQWHEKMKNLDKHIKEAIHKYIFEEQDSYSIYVDAVEKIE